MYRLLADDMGTAIYTSRHAYNQGRQLLNLLSMCYLLLLSTYSIQGVFDHSAQTDLGLAWMPHVV